MPYINFFQATSKTFLEMIQGISAETSLDFCLDAGASASYDGTSQTWTDLSGNSNNFFRGDGSGSEASDPTFNGLAGGLTSSEYFSFDGGDFFEETSGHSFAEEWHQNNAAFTIAGVMYINSGSANQVLFSTTVSNTGVGLMIKTGDTSDKLRLEAGTGVVDAIDIASTASISQDAWHFVAVALNEATGASGATLMIDSTQEAFTSTYSSPAGVGSSSPYNIGARNSGGNDRFASGGRIGMIAGWSRRLTNTELTNLYNEAKTRFTTLP